jgi:hypothetical protein
MLEGDCLEMVVHCGKVMANNLLPVLTGDGCGGKVDVGRNLLVTIDAHSQVSIAAGAVFGGHTCQGFRCIPLFLPSLYIAELS